MARQCKDGFIGEYVTYTRGQASPTIFHMWTAISIVSAILGRRVWMDSGGTSDGYYQIFPNLYVVLVSPSGVGKKSTAMDLGMEILDASGREMQLLRGKITPKRMFTKLFAAASKHPNGDAELYVYAREFKVFTKGVITESSLIEDLTHMYDGKPAEYETEEKGSYLVTRPNINILGGSTPEWLTGGAVGDIMSGGMGARIVPVSVIREEREIAWAKKTKLELDAQARLVADLTDIGTLSGQYYVTQEAMDYFEKWYKVRDRYRKPDRRLDAYYSKKPDLVRKISMVVSASINSELVVTPRHIEYALALLTQIEETILFAYAGVGYGERTKHLDRVLQKIVEAKEISHSELLQSFHYCLDGPDMKRIIDTLLDEESIEREIIPTKTKARVVYKARKKEDKTS